MALTEYQNAYLSAISFLEAHGFPCVDPMTAIKLGDTWVRLEASIKAAGELPAATQQVLEAYAASLRMVSMMQSIQLDIQVDKLQSKLMACGCDLNVRPPIIERKNPSRVLSMGLFAQGGPADG